MTQTQTQTEGFSRGAVATMPNLACLGYVSKVPEGSQTEKKTYIKQPFELTGIYGARSLKSNFLYKPEWFTPGFEVSSIDEKYDEKTAKGIKFVHQRLFGTEDEVGKLVTLGILDGLVGGGAFGDNPSYAGELYAGIKNVMATAGTLDDVISGVRNALHQILVVEHPGTTTGYILKQSREKTDQTDDAGKTIYVTKGYYEIDRFFAPTEKEIEKVIKRAAKDGSNLRIAFEV